MLSLLENSNKVIYLTPVFKSCVLININLDVIKRSLGSLTFESDSISVPGWSGGVCLQVLVVTCLQQCYLDTIHTLPPPP